MINNNLLFSIITCTRNSEKYLQETIDSVSNQDYRNYEHIFIDGHSTDKTLKIIKKYKSKYPGRIRIFTSVPKGIANAMNLGIKHSRGKYLIHLHSDDSFHDNTVLKDATKFLNDHPGYDWIYGKIHVIESDGKTIGYFPTRKIFHFGFKYLLKLINYIPHQAVFIKKSVFEQFGSFQEDIKAMMDQELWLRINYQTKWGYFNRVISHYRVHKDATSSNRESYFENRVEYKQIKSKYLTSTLDRILASLVSIVVESRRDITTR